ncbi:uncharacterized protein PITG_15497 [Phytophthora infestans T30-4]|uniref:Secreted RxLR effector peptide protein n=1 Tax=Phytophthora infestans (strain T30-4) TaxID=403677 RepID=D0NRD9_PHYIT|nr:uncharacterized protein PITG_15497 [Phytophthora infestans T30-4]EEY63261.1 conserved hypothetical protein [Phytophthora infestans T30-4]|eukprot:XP_002898438.1 conserved hypothetical protein [Phytophthora infestans T30-4]
MRNLITASTTFFLLLLLFNTSAPPVLATTECPQDSSYPIKATLDDGKLFSTCAEKSAGVRIDVRSLFDCDMSGKARIHFIPHFASQATGQTKETLKPSMNWMTSGKHRALYSQRGRRRQMHFPSQVQRQRVTPTSPSRSSQSRAGDSTRPWYIVSIGDDDESQDIRVLELERKGAMCTAGIQAEGAAGEPAYGSDSKYIELRSISSQKRGREQEVNAQEERMMDKSYHTRAELNTQSRILLSQSIQTHDFLSGFVTMGVKMSYSHNGKFEAQQHSPDSDNTGVLGHEASTTSRNTASFGNANEPYDGGSL